MCGCLFQEIYYRASLFITRLNFKKIIFNFKIIILKIVQSNPQLIQGITGISLVVISLNKRGKSHANNSSSRPTLEDMIQGIHNIFEAFYWEPSLFIFCIKRDISIFHYRVA
jgi:hypothetical protein